MKSAEELKKSQSDKITEYCEKSKKDRYDSFHATTIDSILQTSEIRKTYKLEAIFYFVLNNTIALEDLKKYIDSFPDDRSSEYRKLLCLYDFKKYS